MPSFSYARKSAGKGRGAKKRAETADCCSRDCSAERSAYAAMFAMKFRTDDPLPMIALPLLAAVNILLAVALIRGTAVAFA